MRTVRRRVLLGLVTAVLLTCGACATSATAAATVGTTSIPEDAIFERTSALADQAQQAGQPAPSVEEIAAQNRTITTTAIRSQVLQVAAEANGVVVTDEQVNALAAQRAVASSAGGNRQVEQQTARDILRLQGLLAGQGTQAVPVTNVKVVVDGVSVPTRQEAVDIRADLLADPSGARALIGASDRQIPRTEVSLLDSPGDAATGVFVAEPGDVLLYPQNGVYLVVRVLDRTVEPGVLTAAQVQQTQSLTAAFDLGALMLQPYAAQAGVTVNPRLGAWDPLAVQVVPGGSGL